MREPRTLQEAIEFFSNPDNCLGYMKYRRWPDGVVCPTCGSRDVRFIPTRSLWECKTKHAKRQFSVKVGTIFEDSAIPLNKWLVAVWMLSNCRNGVSSYEIARTIGVTQKSAWFMLHRIRLGMQDSPKTKIGGGGSPVEVDETYIGGKARFMHKTRRLKMHVSSQYDSKTCVVGMLERGGKVKAAVIGRRKKPVLHKLIADNVAAGTEIHTDEFPAYLGLPSHYVHQIINHLESYVNENIHTNSIENFWSCLKRGLNGTYVAVEPFHLFRYVDEQAFRFNHRRDENKQVISEFDRFDAALTHITGKRLTYAEVTGKVGETPF
jgi:transposase-like protein